MRRYFWLFLLLMTGCRSPQKFLVLTPDFGVKDGAVSAMKGVSAQHAPAVRVSDLTHEIPPYDIFATAYRLEQTYAYWPTGTVFVTVVDPGVGSNRRPVVARTKSGHFFVGPDNGIFSLIDNQFDQVRVIDEKWKRPGSEASYTFHGRDLFVLVGARLADAQIPFEDVGPILPTPTLRLPVTAPEFVGSEMRGMIPILDVNYGNVWTNIPQSLFRSHWANQTRLRVTIHHQKRKVYDAVLPIGRTFSDVPVGQPLIYFNSLMNLALALNQGSFAQKYGIGSGPDWVIRLRAP